MLPERQSDGDADSDAEREQRRGASRSSDAYARGAATDAPSDGAEAGTDATSQADGAPDGAPDAAGPNAAAGQAGPPGASEVGEQRDRYLRLAAEYDNYRKRATRERQEAGTRAQADLVKQLVDALDDLSRFAHVDPASTDVGTITHGVELVERKLLKVLGSAGLEVINPLDQAFDPRL